jgi:hypothetical protein
MSISLRASLSSTRHLVSCGVASLALLVSCVSVAAQSTELEYPSPVTANAISSRIEPRDVGDSRLTRHFYTLTGVPGDLTVTVESKNLNGDVDLFVAGSLRPLAKISLYASEGSTSSAKSIYLRERLPLILRVEARSPNDDPGTYMVRFSGSFEPVLNAAAPPDPVGTSTDRRGSRVNSVGGRVNEPEPEVTASTTPTVTPTATEAAKTETTTPTETAAKPPEETAERPTTARTTRSTRRGRGRRPQRPRPQTQPTQTEQVPPASTSTSNRSDNSPTQLVISARLIIEKRDGMRYERYMSTVRRIMVQNNLIVVETRDGKIERHPLIDVLRMSIEP